MRELPAVLRLHFKAILVAILLALFFRTFVVQIFRVPTHSMREALLPGDHIIVNKFIYSRPPALLASWLPLREVDRGEVLVFRFPSNPAQILVKRCVAGPFDQVEISSEGLFINQRKVDETGYLFSEDLMTALGPLSLPDFSFFCLGDHRQASYDSRAWGPVPGQLIIGKAAMILWSFESPDGRAPSAGFWDRMKAIFSRCFDVLSKSRPERSLRVIR